MNCEVNYGATFARERWSALETSHIKMCCNIQKIFIICTQLLFVQPSDFVDGDLGTTVKPAGHT